MKTWKIGAIIGFLTPIVILFLMAFLNIIRAVGLEVRDLVGVLDFIAIYPAYLLLTLLNRFGMSNPGIAVVLMFATWIFIGAFIGYLIDRRRGKSAESK
jgi:hypothetical protein